MIDSSILQNDVMKDKKKNRKNEVKVKENKKGSA